MRHRIGFFKYQGAGNDFIVLDNLSGSSSIQGLDIGRKGSTSLVPKLCHRHTGIGGDGLIMLLAHPKLDFTMQYYNADGSMGLCGNGARCAAHLASKLLKRKSCTFQAEDVCIQSYVEDNKVTVNWQTTAAIQKLADGYFLNESAAHFVQFVEDMPESILESGRRLRYDKRFAKGANINFVQVQAEALHIRTYERGVEGETMASGTGAVASTRAAYLAGKIKKPRTLVQYQGGTMRVSLNPPYEIPKVCIEGPVHLVYTGEIDLTVEG